MRGFHSQAKRENREPLKIKVLIRRLGYIASCALRRLLAAIARRPASVLGPLDSPPCSRQRFARTPPSFTPTRAPAYASWGMDLAIEAIQTEIDRFEFCLA